jgi:transcriptional regulator with GAF, ATPase, and Fis domain
MQRECAHEFSRSRISNLRDRPRNVATLVFVFLSDSGADAFDAFKGLLLEIAQERELDALLPLIVRRVAESSDDVALARIWLLGPGDSCGTCKNRAACVSQEECLHLVASAVRPRGGEAIVDARPEGAFRRIPVGAFKVGKVLASRSALVVADATTDPHIKRPDWIREEGIKSFAGQPLLYREQVLGVIGTFLRVTLTQQGVDSLRLLANHAAAAIAGARAFDEIARLKQRLEMENEYLREQVTSRESSPIVGSSPAVLQLNRQIELVAPTDASVLIVGESGTGKDLVAEAIHRRSRRAARPLIRVNCAAIPRDLYESEFFGHKRGSFSGALQDRIGRFAAADGGTLFLDEVGEIPLDLQGKLLRVLQEGTFERVGETHSRKADVRIVAATNRDLPREVDEGRFRRDLYYRLNVFPIETEALRERRDDIAPIALHLIGEICRRMRRPQLALSSEQVTDLESREWPGNVRELRNYLERAIIGTAMDATLVELPSRRSERPPRIDAPLSAPPPPSSPSSALATAIATEEEMRKRERDNIVAALDASGGRIYGRTGAAALLGLKPTTLASRLRKLGIAARA